MAKKPSLSVTIFAIITLVFGIWGLFSQLGRSMHSPVYLLPGLLWILLSMGIFTLSPLVRILVFYMCGAYLIRVVLGLVFSIIPSTAPTTLLHNLPTFLRRSFLFHQIISTLYPLAAIVFLNLPNVKEQFKK